MPFFEAFLGVSQGTSTLSDLGFELEKNEFIDGILIAYWRAPESLTDHLGCFVIKMEKDKLLSTELQNKEGKPIASTLFENHIKHNGTFFPLTITTTRFLETGEAVEKVSFSNPVFDELLPPEIVDFEIPQKIEVKELRW